MTERVAATAPSRRSRLGVLLRLLGILALLLVVLGIIGALYENRSQRLVAQSFPPPGELYQVNGRTMHMHCMGEGAPTVILDAGQGGWSTDWTAIMPEIAAQTRVCAYDRAGYGWSDPAQDTRSPQELADDLAALLAAAEIAPPWLLVAYSHAGLPARLFAAQRADEMAGLLLVDPAAEFDNEILSPEFLQQQRSAAGIFSGFGIAARLGLVRLLNPASMAGSAPFIGTNPADPDLYYTFVADPRWWQTSMREFTSRLNDDHLALVRDRGQLPNIPIIIIASDQLQSDNPALVALQGERHARHAQLAQEAPQAQFTIAEGSSHDILAERPDAILDAIRAILQSTGSP